MALYATIKDEKSAYHLPDNVLVSYHFHQDTSGYTKVYPHVVKLHLEIDVRAMLDNEGASLKENEELLESLRAWGKLTYSEISQMYYHSVELTHTHGDEVFREIRLSHAYVESFHEAIDLGSRDHIIKLELQQKRDMLNYLE